MILIYFLRLTEGILILVINFDKNIRVHTDFGHPNYRVALLLGQLKLVREQVALCLRLVGFLDLI